MMWRAMSERVLMVDLSAACQTDVFVSDLDCPAFKKIASLAADGDELGRLAGVRLQKRLCRLYNVRVESTGEAFIGADQDDEIFLIAARIKQRMRQLVGNSLRSSRSGPRTSFARTAARP